MLKIEATIYLILEEDGGMNKPGFFGMQPSFNLGDQLIMCRIYPLGNEKEIQLGVSCKVSILLPYGEKYIDMIQPNFNFGLNIGGKSIGNGVVNQIVSNED